MVVSCVLGATCEAVSGEFRYLTGRPTKRQLYTRWYYRVFWAKP
jgi:hypothetical protein